MPLTRLENLISSKSGKYLYVSPDDFNATDTLDNRGNSPNRPFKTIQRAFIEVARYSYAPGLDNDRFDQFTIMLMPGEHFVDNRPGMVDESGIDIFNFNQALNAWDDNSVVDLANPDNVLYKFNAKSGGAIVPRGCSLIGYDLRRTIVRPLYVPNPADKEQPRTSIFNLTGGCYLWQFTIKDGDLTSNSPLYDPVDGYGKVYSTKDPFNIVSNSHADARNLILANKQFIAEESVNRMLNDPTVGTSSGFSVPGGSVNCKDDVEAILEELVYNLQYGGNDRVYESAKLYLDGAHVSGEEDQTKFVFEQARDISIQVMRNETVSTEPETVASGQTQSKDLTITVDTNTPTCAAVAQSIDTLWDVMLSAIGTTANPGTLVNFEANNTKITPSASGLNEDTLLKPEYSHHKICIMVYADNSDLGTYYKKVAKAFSLYQPTIDDDGEFAARVQENRIVGPLSDTRSIDQIKVTDISTAEGSSVRVTVTTKIDHGYFVGQYVAIANNGLEDALNGTFEVESLPGDTKVFTYVVEDNTTTALGLINNKTYTTSVVNEVSPNAFVQAEIDSVESASPYVFNCSIRSTWGMCGMWADGSRSTGFRSMVVAQYTGVSLQKDDRAFIRYDEFSNTWNQASLKDAFGTVAYHTKGDAYWKDDWRNFHIRASNDSFIQCVSVFAVGFHDHFLMESGGDMSITNSNSNFGNTSLHAIGHKGYAFNQDKGGYITDIIPPQFVRDAPLSAIGTANSDARINAEKQSYYTLDVRASNDATNHTRLYLGGDTVRDPATRPAATIGGYRIGARTNERIFVGDKAIQGTSNTEFSAELQPNGFRKFTVSLETLNPDGASIDNNAQDSANRIEENKEFIQEQTYNYIVTRYPDLLTNTQITISKCQRDVGYILDAVIQDLRLSSDTTNPDTTTNVNTIQAAESYFIGSTLTYIDGEKLETLEGFDYAKNLAIAAMRNWDLMIGPENGSAGCSATAGTSTVNVGDTRGLVIGMKVEQYIASNFTNGKLNAGATPITTVIPANTYIKKILNSFEIEIGTSGSYLDSGSSAVVGGSGTTTSMYLHFVLENGVSFNGVAPTTTPTADYTITQSTEYPECAGIANAINQYFTNIALIIENGPTTNGVPTVARVEPSVSSTQLAARTTLFTADTGNLSSNAHNLQTGTAVRLVPRAKAGTNPDKRLIRLPKGFDPNTKYYIIAPARTTFPRNYNDSALYPGKFDGSDPTKFMLAITKENAAAGIYIYSSETDSVDPNVEIDMYQYVLDDKYDLHKYTCNLLEVSPGTTSSTDFEADVPHIFDTPTAETPQAVFFRVAKDITGSTLPQLSGAGLVPTQTYYYARFKTPRTFTLHETAAEAVSGNNPVNFVQNTGQNFYIFMNKRTSALRFDASYNASAAGNINANDTGLWYLNVKNESTIGSTDFRPESILHRYHQSDRDDANAPPQSFDTWFERIIDEREREDRVYRLRYVLPKDVDPVREPLNGFTIKVRTDDTRRLLPQKILLKPEGGAANLALFENPVQAGEFLGYTNSQLSALSIESTYDPYVDPKVIETNNYVSFSVQSAKQVDGFLELTVFDHTITNNSLKNESFSTVEISAPQGGNFVEDKSASTAASEIQWTGYSSGTANIHAVTTVSGVNGTRYYLILKNRVSGEVVYNANQPTTFSQTVGGTTITAVLQGKPDSVGGGIGYQITGQDQDPIGGFSKSSKQDYLYRQEGSNVYTVTPGDRIVDENGGTYIIETVEDVGEIEDTFYIFDIEEIQRRISGQTDGIYYLTCVRGNISPYPLGPGVGTNFHYYRFSQPISSLYPQNFKNDPLWFQAQVDGTEGQTKAIDGTIVDPPQTTSAADNYVHGLVRTSDVKSSLTKETISDLIQQPALSGGDFTGDNEIKGQEGNASQGSEGRRIAIRGNNEYPTQDKIYVELRRSSIARSGNHTFEYLGFGPGNYSTGFPLRQEVVLSDLQDFYAQAKREDAGIVFYTGLNSNGDLYIGNRKINAITGEETFLESAELLDSEDEDDSVQSLVTTFQNPVTFNDKITVEGISYLNNSVEINVDPSDGEGDALRVFSNVPAVTGNDLSLARGEWLDPNDGDIVLNQNKIQSAIFALNARGNTEEAGQIYSIKTHLVNGSPSNISPNQNVNKSVATTTVVSGSTITEQFVTYSKTLGSGAPPESGDMLFKGEEVGKSGSLGSIFSNFYTVIGDTSISQIQPNGTTTVKIIWVPTVDNDSLNIQVGSKLRIRDFSFQSLINGSWYVTSAVGSDNFCEIIVVNEISAPVNPWMWANLPTDTNGNIIAEIALEDGNWKEFGVLGAEALRTETDTWGNFKLGINTISREDHDAYESAWVGQYTVPRATLDVSGTTFISGTVVTETNFFAEDTASNRTLTGVNNALLVGGDYLTPNNTATLRVSTLNDRLGINVDNANLDRSLVVVGNARITQDTLFESNIAIEGGNVTTQQSIFNLLDGQAETFNMFGDALNLYIADKATGTQTVSLGNAVTQQSITIGSSATTSLLDIHNASTNSTFGLGLVANDNSAHTSNINIGGAFANLSNSLTSGSVFNVRSRYTILDGDLTIGNNASYTTANFQANAQTLNFITTSVSTMNFARSVGQLSFGADGGLTTINNSLLVKASATVNGNITLSGGLNAGEVTVQRGVIGTPPTAHGPGGIENPNIDLFKKSEIERDLDTQGTGSWGGTSGVPAQYQDTTAGNDYTWFLPLDEAYSTDDITVGSYLLIDRTTAVSQQNTTLSPVGEQYSELLKVIGLENPGNTGGGSYISVKVERGQNGLDNNGEPLSTYIRDDHPDNAKVIKFDLSENVSWITNQYGVATATTGTQTDIQVAEFGGSLAEGDILRLSDSELTKVISLTTTSIQSFVVHDGGSPSTTMMSVESTTGNTFIRGVTTIEDSVILNGSLSENFQFFKITNGDGGQRFYVDSATGDTCIYGDLGVGGSFCDKLTVNGSNGDTLIKGGNFTVSNATGIDGVVGGETKLFLQQSTGDLKISGAYTSTNPNGINTLAGDLVVNGGDFTINSTLAATTITGDKIFEVNNDGSIDAGGMTGYLTPTGARKWLYLNTGSGGAQLQSNINYFIRPTGNLVLLLPTNPTTGDMIRLIDIGGNLTYNVTLRIRAASNTLIQGDGTNTGQYSDVPETANSASHGSGSGELVVQTPNAALGLVYVGDVDYLGQSTNAPTDGTGWWLMEV